MDLLNVAQIMREMRQRQKMTLDALAEKSGLTKGYLSKLENFRVSPSLPALSKIAESLGVPIAAFFQESYQAPPYVIGTIDDGHEIDRNDGQKFGLRYYSLAFNKVDRIMDPFIIRYEPKTNSIREPMMHDADEFFVVMKGTIDFFLCDMNTKQTLQQGQTIYLSKNFPHTSTLAQGCDYAEALVVYCRAAEVAP